MTALTRYYYTLVDNAGNSLLIGSQAPLDLQAAGTAALKEVRHESHPSLLRAVADWIVAHCPAHIMEAADRYNVDTGMRTLRSPEHS